MSSVLSPSPPQAPAPPPAETEPLSDSEQLFEVVDGIRVEKPVSAASIWIASRLNSRLDHFVTANELGTAVTEMVFILDSTRNLRRRPDVAFVSAAKWPVGQMPPIETDWAIIPDLAIEVISPGNRYTEVVRKLREYFEYGVGEVWLILPEERLAQVYSSPDGMATVRGDGELKTELVPGWSMAVSALIPAIVATTVPQPLPSE